MMHYSIKAELWTRKDTPMLHVCSSSPVFLTAYFTWGSFSACFWHLRDRKSILSDLTCSKAWFVAPWICFNWHVSGMTRLFDNNDSCLQQQTFRPFISLSGLAFHTSPGYKILIGLMRNPILTGPVISILTYRMQKWSPKWDWYTDWSAFHPAQQGAKKGRVDQMK